MSAGARLSPDSLLHRSPRIVFEPFDNEWLAIDGEAGYCYSLNATAGHVWRLIETPLTLRALVEQMCPRYAVDPATCQADVEALIQQLLEYGLVQMVAPVG